MYLENFSGREIGRIEKAGRIGRIEKAGRIGKTGRIEKTGRNEGAEIINKFFFGL